MATASTMSSKIYITPPNTNPHADHLIHRLLAVCVYMHVCIHVKALEFTS